MNNILPPWWRELGGVVASGSNPAPPAFDASVTPFNLPQPQLPSSLPHVASLQRRICSSLVSVMDALDDAFGADVTHLVTRSDPTKSSAESHASPAEFNVDSAESFEFLTRATRTLHETIFTLFRDIQGCLAALDAVQLHFHIVASAAYNLRGAVIRLEDLNSIQSNALHLPDSVGGSAASPPRPLDLAAGAVFTFYLKVLDLYWAIVSPQKGGDDTKLRAIVTALTTSYDAAIEAVVNLSVLRPFGCPSPPATTGDSETVPAAVTLQDFLAASKDGSDGDKLASPFELSGCSALTEHLAELDAAGCARWTSLRSCLTNLMAAGELQLEQWCSSTSALVP